MTEFFKKYITAKNVIFFIITILFLVFLTKIKDIAILFFASYVISCSLNPLVDKLTNKKIKRQVASILVLLGSLFAFFLILFPIVVVGGQQVVLLLESIPKYISNIQDFIVNSPLLGSTDLSQLDFNGIIAQASDVTSSVITKSIDVSKYLATSIIYFLAGCLIIYYMLVDRTLIKDTYLKLFPQNIKQRAMDIMASISQKIGGYVVAQITTMMSVGLIVFIGLALLGVDYALILGLITAVFDLVPVVGPAAALVIILIAIFKLGWIKICLAIIVFIFAQWAENNLVRPYVFSKFMDVHPLIIYFFLLLTAQYLGIIGVVFAPAIAATVCVLIEELYIKSINE